MTNPFLAYAETRSRRPMKPKVVRSDADAPMKPTAIEQAHRDKSAQMRLYREHQREELDVARKGEFGDDIHELEKFIRRMTIDSGVELVDRIARSRLPTADIYTRRVAMRLVGDACERLRVQNDLAPFDDSLPGEDPTVFEQCRMELGVP